ncbi:MAG: hypothetical protein L0287_19810 [Anaerolineae bacterium]|nr:hypothetical protein [Anaerolineae bacterium]
MTAEGVSYTITPEDIRAIKAWLEEHREPHIPLDIVLEGESPGTDSVKANAIVRPLAEAGATWWLEDVATTPYQTNGLDGIRTRIKQGPPQLI